MTEVNKPRMIRAMRLRSLIVFSILPFALAAAAAAPATKPRAVQHTTNITLGGLFSLTGDGATLGIASQAALDLAARDLEQEFDDLHLPYHITTTVADTKLTPAIAAAKLPELAAQGALIVIGPQSSAEAGAVREYADAHGILLISQGSTASSLAIAGDNLFRLAPNDKLEGAAMAALMRADNIDTVIPLWRADAGNTGLHDSTKRSLEAGGGTMLPGASYDPATTDFTASVAAIGTALRSAKSANPSARIAVYLASFEEAAAIFELARLDTDLQSVRWYGGDGVTQSQALLANANAAQFAAATSFTAPNVGLDDATSDRWQPISDEIKSRVGFEPDAYALSVYDAAWVGVLSLVEAQLSPDHLRASFVRNVQRYWGLTGPTALDDAGDRRFANFDFWSVQNVHGTPQWVRTAQYSGGHIAR
jgi:branched-chain amino acid transport system substrate-binding protein